MPASQRNFHLRIKIDRAYFRLSACLGLSIRFFWPYQHYFHSIHVVTKVTVYCPGRRLKGENETAATSIMPDNLKHPNWLSNPLRIRLSLSIAEVIKPRIRHETEMPLSGLHSLQLVDCVLRATKVPA